MNESISDRWERIGGEDGREYLRFDRVVTKRCNRPDLHAFLLLNEQFPDTVDIISGAGHDEIFLDVSDRQAESLSDEQILELIRCGVRYGDFGLCMFV